MKMFPTSASGLVLGLTTVFTFSFGVSRLAAEEGGSGHYMPGMLATYIDAAPTKGGASFQTHFNYYHGDIHGTLPVARQPVVDATVESFTFNMRILGTLSSKFLGANYSIGAILPLTKEQISRNVTVGGNTVKREDEVGDIGDIPLLPIVLAWQHGNWQTDFFFTIYAPAGQYNAGFLANTSKNYWTYEPTIALQFYDPKSLLSFTLTTGADFNDRNSDTDYDSGDSIHAEVSFAKFFARDKGSRFGLGLNGTYYDQYKADKGTGAILGDFQGRTTALGPTLTWAMKDAWQNMMIELKWLPEWDVKNRPKGDVFWLKFAWIY